MRKFKVNDKSIKPVSVGETYRVMSWRSVMKSGIFAIVSAISAPSAAESDPGGNITIALSSRIVASPAGTGEAAGIVPGAMIDYFVSVSGPVKGKSPPTAFAVIDVIPKHLSLFVGDLAGVDAGPVLFSDNDSGLQFSFEGLASATDSIEFSNNGGKTFDYVPVADNAGYDQNITHVKIRPSGALLPTDGKYERFSLRYRMKVK